MRFAILLFTLLAAQAWAQLVNETYIKELIVGLDAANFTVLANAFQSISTTPEGTALLAALAGNPISPRNLFAPVNDAFASFPEEVSRNTTLMTNILSYHILNDIKPHDLSKSPEHDFFATQYVNRRLGRTPLLQRAIASLVNDTEGKERIGFPYQNGGMAYADVEALDLGLWNLIVYPVDSVFDLPPDLDQVTKAHAPAFAEAMEQAGLMGSFSSRQGGVTLFVPEDAAWKDAAGWLGTLSPDQLHAVQSNHFINHTAMETRSFPAKLRSEIGQILQLSRNDTGYYVSSNLTTAKVIKTDVPAANGRVHVIDRVLMMEVATGAVSSAAGSRFTATGTAGWSLAMAVGTFVGMALI